MVPPLSMRIPRARTYSGYCCSASLFAYKALTSFGSASHQIRLNSAVVPAVLTPQALLPAVWPLPLSLATTYGISFDFSSSAYLDVSVRRVPRTYLCIQYALRHSSCRGFPHSDICGSKLACSSPQLFAAGHVLLRLLVPRHSPCALPCLISFNSACCSFHTLPCFFFVFLLCFCRFLFSDLLFSLCSCQGASEVSLKTT